MNECLSEPRDSSCRKEGKDYLAKSPIFRRDSRLPAESRLCTPSLSPCQAKSICHLHCVGYNGVSVLDTRGELGEGTEEGRGEACFCCHSVLLLLKGKNGRDSSLEEVRERAVVSKHVCLFSLATSF